MAETLQFKKRESIFDEMEQMQNRITQRAYDIFQINGSCPGRDLEDWLQAEQELTGKTAIELEEKDNEFRVKVAIPGVDPKDIDIEVTPEDILVKATHRHEHKEKKGEVHASGNLFRSIHLPRKINTSKVKAEFRNGILTLRAAVAEEARAGKVTEEAA